MVRGGVPQSIAMRVTGHRSPSMFTRYDITSTDDKLDALRKAREYAATRSAVRENVAPFPAMGTQQGTRGEKPAHLLGNMVALKGFEPPATEETALKNRNPEDGKPR